MTVNKTTSVEEHVANRKPGNIKLLMALALLVVGLWGMTFFFRLSYIKGLAE